MEGAYKMIGHNCTFIRIAKGEAGLFTDCRYPTSKSQAVCYIVILLLILAACVCCCCGNQGK